MIPIQESGGSVTFAVKVHPRARKNAITGELGDALKVPDLASSRRPRQQGLHRILRKTFEGAAIFRYHCLRPDQPQKSIRVAGLSAEEVRDRNGR